MKQTLIEQGYIPRASLQWISNEPIEVGESGTLYRFLKFASWKWSQKREFILNGTLKERKPTLRGHESNRLTEMEKALEEKEISYKDHRVVQAVVMFHKGNIMVKYPSCVKKSWPQFWRFIMNASFL